MAEVKEWRVKCNVCGNVVKAQGTKAQLDEWMKQDFGECPAGGRHVEVGKRESYMKVIDVSDQLSEIKRWRPDPKRQYVDIQKVAGLTHIGFGAFQDEKGHTYDYEVDEKGRRHYYIK